MPAVLGHLGTGAKFKQHPECLQHQRNMTVC